MTATAFPGRRFNTSELKQDHNPALAIEGIVINQFNAQAKLPQTLIDEMKQEQLPVINRYLSASVKMKESHHLAKPLIYFAPNHKLTQQFIALFDYIEGKKNEELAAPVATAV